MKGGVMALSAPGWRLLLPEYDYCEYVLQERPQNFLALRKVRAHHARFNARKDLTAVEALQNALYKVVEGCLAALYPEDMHAKVVARKLTGTCGAVTT